MIGVGAMWVFIGLKCYCLTVLYFGPLASIYGGTEVLTKSLLSVACENDLLWLVMNLHRKNVRLHFSPTNSFQSRGKDYSKSSRNIKFFQYWAL